MMVGGLVLVAVLVIGAYWAGRALGHSEGRRDAFAGRQRTDRTAELIATALLDEPGNPRLN